MITRCAKPREFDLLPIQECFECFDDKGPYLYIGLEVIGPYCGCHAAVMRWNHKAAQAMKADIKDLIENYLKPAGVKKLTASFPNASDKVWPKFIRLFGFPEPQKVMLSTMEI